jgi:FAD/FMN-containing dehydrogenase
LSSTSTSSSSIPELRGAFDGRVTVPDDPGYDQARKVFYGKYDRRPAAIVRPVDPAEVAQVVGLARDGGLELAVRSGGHSLAGHSTTEGGIVLDLSELTALDVDLEGRTAWAQTGLTAGAYTTAVGAHGLATGFGDTASVGIGGLTLGGGIPTCSGPSAAAGATSGWPPASGSGCTSCPRSWAGCCCCRAAPR